MLGLKFSSLTNCWKCNKETINLNEIIIKLIQNGQWKDVTQGICDDCKSQLL